MKRYGFAGIVILLIVATIFMIQAFSQSDTSEHQTDGPSMRGLCWVGGDSIANHNMTQIMDIHANYISQTPFGWMEGYDSPNVVLSNERAWWGEADRGLKHTTLLAKEAGIKTMLKPHIWLRRSGDKWRSDIAMNSPEEWKAWFESYSTFILHYAKLAEATGMESLCIGTELYQTTKQHPEEWRKIIKAIRKVYHGQLTYAANWYLEFEEITFWDELDFIGIQAYFPLADSNHPSKKTIRKAWEKHKPGLEKVSKKFNKKIVFTEIGYKNTPDAATEPWTWPQDMDTNTETSEETQIHCYEALFESLWNEAWFDGIFIWKWFHTTHKFKDFDSYFEARWERRKNWAKKRNRNLGPQVYFTPQRGKALEVLKEYFAK